MRKETESCPDDTCSTLCEGRFWWILLTDMFLCTWAWNTVSEVLAEYLLLAMLRGIPGIVLVQNHGYHGLIKALLNGISFRHREPLSSHMCLSHQAPHHWWLRRVLPVSTVVLRKGVSAIYLKRKKSSISSRRCHVTENGASETAHSFWNSVPGVPRPP